MKVQEFFDDSSQLLCPSTSSEAILRKVKESHTTSLAFFERNSQIIVKVAWAMADRFRQGGRLFVAGNGGSACDAEHLCVEFMHPIFEKRKALPCISLSSQSALLTAIANDTDFSQIFSKQLRELAREKDMVLAFSTSGKSPNLVSVMQAAKQLGLMTIAVSGKDGGRLENLVDFSLVVGSYSVHRIQETHVMFLHVLWDTIHLLMGEEDIV